MMSIAIEELLPHRAPMRWVEELVEYTDTTAVATVRIGPEHFAVREGVLLETALVECVAQTVAAALGNRMRSSGNAGGANQGMLAAVSGFKVFTHPKVGQTLTVETREVKRLGPMLLVAATITCEGQAVATGELSLYA